MKKLFNLKTSFIIFGLVLIVGASPVFVFGTDLSDQARELKEERQEYRQKADKAEKEANGLVERVAMMNEQVKQVAKEIKKTSIEIKKIEKSIVDTEKEISQKEIELIEQKELLAEAIRYLYEEGDQPFIDTLFTSDSFNEAIDRTEYLTTAELRIEQTAEEIIFDKEELENKEITLKNQIENLEELKIQLKESNKIIKEERKEKAELLSKTQGKENRYQELVSAKEAEQRVVLERIRQLEDSGKGKRYSGDQNNKQKKKDIKPSKSETVFQWPLKNFSIGQNYGCTSFAKCGNKNGPYGGKPHNGIDISSVPGKSGFLDLRVRSVADGKVIMNAPKKHSGGWGNAVIISHPNGLFTLYSHLARSIVKEGQKVKKGQMIGIEGNTGFSTGRHLHFSVYMEIVIYKTEWYYGPGYNFEYTLDPTKFLPKR